MVADLGIRLQEGIQELKLEQQLAPAREAMARTLTVGSTNFFKAVEGVRGRWAQRTSPPSLPESESSRASTPPVEVSKADVEDSPRTAQPVEYSRKTINLRPFSLTSTNSLELDSPSSPNNTGSAAVASTAQQLSAWSTGFGSFLSAKAPRFSLLRTPTSGHHADAVPPMTSDKDGRIKQPIHEVYGEPEGSPLFNGMSPGTSPTNVTAGDVPSIESVLEASESTRTLVPSGSTSALEKTKEK